MNVSDFLRVVPYKLKKRINKTGEGRSGLEIYKRRNRRDYRVIIQYVTWNRILHAGNLEFLNHYGDGYAVMITPQEYFGDNYPHISNTLNPNFILGVTGFVYYGNINDFNQYPPLDSWEEVYELSTRSDHSGGRAWVGEVVFNIKNARPNKVSMICKNETSKTKEEKLHCSNLLTNKYGINENQIPSQSGLGNYDYDYATRRMIDDVKLQMLYLCLNAKSESGQSFADYIINNIEDIRTDNDNNLANWIDNNQYQAILRESLNNLRSMCSRRNLLDFQRLESLGVGNIVNNTPMCPLCKKDIFIEDFFKEVEQQEGRQVFDNTQRSIVLMHVHALRPGELNHSTYNLGWGHNFCNLIQGDKDIEDTIIMLENLINNYHNR